MVMRQRSKRHNPSVYSLEPNKLVRSEFARKYVSYLLPVLKQIYEENESHRDDDKSSSNPKLGLEKIVGYEVNMAMVVSTSTYHFAWSRALKQKLQICYYVLKYGSRSSLSRLRVPKPLNYFLPDIPNCNNHSKMVMTKPCFGDRKLGSHGSGDDEEKKIEEEEMIEKKLSSLRRVLPGGNEMGDDNELLAEVGSYINCLQLQVNILRCLVGTHKVDY